MKSFRTTAGFWAEYIPNLQRAEYMIFPRETGLAEIDGSATPGRSYADFLHGLQVQYRRFDELGINCRCFPEDAPATDSTK